MASISVHRGNVMFLGLFSTCLVEDRTKCLEPIKIGKNVTIVALRIRSSSNS